MSTTALEKAAFDEGLYRALLQSPDGQVKEASDASTGAIRIRLREQAISPAVLPLTEISPQDLSQFLDSDRPGKIYEMEAGQPGPTSGPLNYTGDASPFSMSKFKLTFYKNRTPVWEKNIYEINTYKSDIRQLIVDNSLRDLARQKDFKFFEGVDAIVGAINGGISPITGFCQNVLYPGRLDRNNLVSSDLLFADRAQPTGVHVMNIRTWSEFKRWTRNDMGGDMAQKLILDGTKAINEAEIDGVKCIVTMFNDIIPNGVIYQFAPPNFLGKGGTMQKPTMYVKKEKDMLQFSCEEMIGYAIGNPLGLQKVSFHDLLGPGGGDGRLPVNTR